MLTAMLKAFIRWGDGKITRDTDAATLSRALHDEHAVFWLDMNQPTDDEVELLADVFCFHPLAIEDSLKYAQRPKVEDYSHRDEGCSHPYFYMVVHGPDLETFRQKLRTKELDIFMSQRFLVTHHEEQFKSINEVLARGEYDPRRLMEQGLDMLLYQILDRITDHYQPILDYLEGALDELEDEAIDRPA